MRIFFSLYLLFNKKWAIFPKKSTKVSVLKQIDERTTVNHCFNVCMLKTSFLLFWILKHVQKIKQCFITMHFSLNFFFKVKNFISIMNVIYMKINFFMIIFSYTLFWITFEQYFKYIYIYIYMYLFVLKQILETTTVNHCFNVCTLKILFLLIRTLKNVQQLNNA